MGKRAGLGRPTYTSLWFRLLKQQKERGSTGFTLSFLIGAAISGIKLDEDAAYGELAGLLSSFANETPVGFHVVIGNCTKLRQPVASIYRAEEEKPWCHPVMDRNANALALYAEDGYFRRKKRDLDSLVDGLFEFLQSPLVRGEYSYREGAYRAFSAEDLRTIASAQERT